MHAPFYSQIGTSDQRRKGQILVRKYYIILIDRKKCIHTEVKRGRFSVEILVIVNRGGLFFLFCFLLLSVLFFRMGGGSGGGGGGQYLAQWF